MGDESGDVTAIKLPVRNERQSLRLLVLGFLTEPAHSGMQPALPIPVETFAPPYNLETSGEANDAKRIIRTACLATQKYHIYDYFSIS